MVSPNEIMKGSILSFEGKAQVVKGISDFIIFDGRKEWIGGSMINGEALTDEWLERLGFKNEHDGFYWEDHLTPRVISINKGNEFWYVKISVSGNEPTLLHAIAYVHQLQIIFFGLIGEHLKLPKLKK
jgi:hypothetical protein